jgi:hypothetical protein
MNSRTIVVKVLLLLLVTIFKVKVIRSFEAKNIPELIKAMQTF